MAPSLKDLVASGQAVAEPDQEHKTGSLADMVASGQASASDAPETMGRIRAASLGVSQGGTLGFSDEIAPAVVDWIRARQGLSPIGEHLKRRMREDIKQAAVDRPGYYYGGEVAGGLALPMPGGSAAQGAKWTTKLGIGALRGIPMGLAYGLGKSEADLSKGEYGQAALDTMLGGVAGAAGGAIGEGVIAPLAQKATPYVGRAAGWAGEKLDDIASMRALKQAGFIQKDLKALRGGDARALQIGRDLRSTGAVAPLRSVAGVEKATTGLRNKWGARIGEVVDEADRLASTADLPSGSSIGDRIRADVVGPTAASPANASYVKGIDDIAEAYSREGEAPVSMSLLKDWKTAQRKAINWKSDALPQEFKRDAYGVLKDELNQGVTSIGNRYGKPELGPQLEEANRLFSSLKPASERAAEGVARETGNQQVGLKDAIFATAAAAAGVPVAAPAVGMASKLARQYGSSLVGPAAAGAGKAMTALKGALKTNPQSLGRFAGALTNAASRGDEAFAATNYVLAQKFPEYRRLIEQFATQNGNPSEPPMSQR